jgi:hypothetical protein
MYGYRFAHTEGSGVRFFCHHSNTEWQQNQRRDLYVYKWTGYPAAQATC